MVLHCGLQDPVTPQEIIVILAECLLSLVIQLFWTYLKSQTQNDVVWVKIQSVSHIGGERESCGNMMQTSTDDKVKHTKH